jgi:hypothetical protein
MRAAVVWVVVAGLAAAGCSKSSAPAAGAWAGPGFRVAWPGPPQEMPASASGGSYMAFYADKTPGRVRLYGASVTDLGAEAGNAMTPRERLAAFTLASEKDQVSRTAIEHGSGKLPGLDIVVRTGGKLRRQLFVASGTRIFEVSVTAPTQDDLGAQDVKAFFDSFAVDG